MKTYTYAIGRTSFWVTIAMITMLINMTGCSTDEIPQKTTIQATAQPGIKTCSDNCLTTPPLTVPAPLDTIFLQTCDSEQFLISARIIENSEHVDIHQRKIAAHEQLKELLVHLDVLSNSIPYAAPVPLQVTLVNGSNQAVKFVRPQEFAFEGDGTIPGNSLVVGIVSASGEKVTSSRVDLIFGLSYAPPLTAFSTLSPEASCNINMPLDWNARLEAPLSPGDYQMRARLYLADAGPRPWEKAREYVDIGARVGFTDYSNTVTFTVLPPN